MQLLEMQRINKIILLSQLIVTDTPLSIQTDSGVYISIQLFLKLLLFIMFDEAGKKIKRIKKL